MLHVMCHMSHVLFHMSHVMCHVSEVACHMSNVMCKKINVFFLQKCLSISLEGLLSTGPTPSSLWCLLCIIRELAEGWYMAVNVGVSDM